ncbi:antitoxin [Salirhabdus salicampi]|uniref:antitoxin n=1 Tax=Salirhabdus salicampi TaxID=476102 RepID=UPI00266C67EF|nr:antitoxin [Salirhabdus salicampi]
MDRIGKYDGFNRNDLICQAVQSYLREKKKRDIRESMRRGYVEMANINLDIASEAFQAEEEAENTLERLVSGG